MKMKASAKRFIWFFGFNLLIIVSEYSDFLITGIGWESTSTIIGVLLWMFLPLLAFEDDTTKPKKSWYRRYSQQ